MEYNHLLERSDSENGDFDLLEELAPHWNKLGSTLGILKKDLDVIKSGAAADYVRLKLVWSKWFNRTEELSHTNNYPPTWKGLRKLLVDSGHEEIANRYFLFMSKSL